jgi:hypothetical protein
MLRSDPEGVGGSDPSGAGPRSQIRRAPVAADPQRPTAQPTAP